MSPLSSPLINSFKLTRLIETHFDRFGCCFGWNFRMVNNLKNYVPKFNWKRSRISHECGRCSVNKKVNKNKTNDKKNTNKTNAKKRKCLPSMSSPLWSILTSHFICLRSHLMMSSEIEECARWSSNNQLSISSFN